MALAQTMSTKKVAEAFSSNIISLYRIPKSIVSDGDPIFLSNFWNGLFNQLGT